jgi:hypothetical protein
MNIHTTPSAYALSAAQTVADHERDDADQATRDQADPVHALCEAWATWCYSRRYFGRPVLPPSVLGKLSLKTRPIGTADTPTNWPALVALHMAVLAQPDALDRQVFELHYLRRPRHIKTAADLVGMSSRHWYRLVSDFRQRAYAASCEILADNLTTAVVTPPVTA